VNMSSIARVLAKRLIGLWKGVRLEGRGYVSVQATVRGRGGVILGDEARLEAGSEVRVRRRGSLKVGERSVLSRGVVVVADGGTVKVGRDSALRFYSLVYGAGGVTIGDRVLIGNHVLISSVDHVYDGVASVASQPMRCGEVVIEDDVWIGGQSIILAGVRIGAGAIVGAHSLVKADVPPYAVVGGSPARVLRMRTECID
jgi:carbonic anhydrase/acetyltransferase-like protein (isoleucine patch superfamily)